MTAIRRAQSVLYCRVEANRQEVGGAGLNPGILEGIWEELAVHAGEFRERKLIVLPTEPEVTGTAANETGLQEAARRLFTEADNIEREPGRLSSDPYTRAFGEIIAEKYRKMGLKL